MKSYCVVYLVCGVHYRFRGYYNTKSEAKKDCVKAMGIKSKDIVEAYED